VVVVGLNDPQAVVSHVTVHFTWGFAETSLAIAACSGPDVLTCSEAGVAPKKFTAIGIGPVMVILAEADLLVSAIEVAVTVTVEPEGIAAGAVYVIALRSALVLKEPQAPGVPQITDHVTRLFPTRTVIGNVAAAISVADALIARDVGGGVRNRTAFGSEGGMVGGPLKLPPHPVSPAIVPRQKRTVLRNDIRAPLRSITALVEARPFSQKRSHLRGPLHL
jgi:hypothetical protein